MRFYLVSDDEVLASAIRSAILDRGLEFPASDQCRILGVPGLLSQLAPPVVSSLPGWGARDLPEDNQVTIILSQPPEDSTLEKPLCGIYFNLSSPYHKKRTPQLAKVEK